MREPKETLQAGVSLDLTQTLQSEPRAWKAPTLTAWKIEEETLAEPGSGPEPAPK
jgi:hypothetical protein